MVEFKYTTKDEFMDQVLQLVEEMGMRPPYNAADDDETDSCEWEKE